MKERLLFTAVPIIMDIFKRQKFQWPALWSGCQRNGIQYTFGTMCVLRSAVLVDEASWYWYWYVHIKQFTGYLIWINTHSIKLSLFHYLWIISTHLIQTDFTFFAWLLTVSCVRKYFCHRFIVSYVLTCPFHDPKMLRSVFQHYWFFYSFSSY
jgi:hypothetical protein